MLPQTFRQHAHDMQHMDPFAAQLTKRKTVIEVRRATVQMRDAVSLPHFRPQDSSSLANALHHLPSAPYTSKQSTHRQGPLPPLDLAELQAEFDRYGSLVAELQQQASVHSTKLAKLLGKLWVGTARTLGDLFRMNAVLAGERTEARREARRVQQGATDAKGAYMVELDQMKLQLTVMRAALVEKEAELAAERRINKVGARALRGAFSWCCI